MKVSEVITSKNEEQSDRVSKSQLANPGTENSTTARNGRRKDTSRNLQSLNFIESHEPAKSKNGSRSSEVKSIPSNNSKSSISTNDQSNVKKPWIPCTRRNSRPKPLPAILDMELSVNNRNNICKKFPKSPSPDSVSSDGEKIKRKYGSDTNDNYGNNASNNHPSTVFQRLTSKNSNNGNGSSNLHSSVERRGRASLKRQFALDKATAPSMKEANSEESLNSINSVTQLLKIERSAFVMNKNRRNDKEEDEEILTGVKLIKAKLEAKVANNLAYNQHVFGSDFSATGQLKSNNRFSNVNDKTTNMPSLKIRNIHKISHQMHMQNNLQNKIGQQENLPLNLTTSATAANEQQDNILTTQQISTKTPHTTSSGIPESSSTSSLLNATIAVASPSSSLPPLISTQRKKASSSNNSTANTSTTSTKQTTSSAPAARTDPKLTSPEKGGKETSIHQSSNSTRLKSSKIRSRSNSPVKHASSAVATAGFSLQSKKQSCTGATVLKADLTKDSKNWTTITEIIQTSNSNDNKIVNKVGPRRGNSRTTVDAPIQRTSSPSKVNETAAATTSLAKQANQIKETHKGIKPTISTVNRNATAVDTFQRKRIVREILNENGNKVKSVDVTADTIKNIKAGGQGHTKSVNTRHGNSTDEKRNSSRGRSRLIERDDSSSRAGVMRYAMSTVASRANTNNSQISCNNNSLLETTNTDVSFVRKGSWASGSSQASSGENNSRKSRSRKVVNGSANASSSSASQELRNRNKTLAERKLILEENLKLSSASSAATTKRNLEFDTKERNYNGHISNIATTQNKDNNSKNSSRVSSEDVLNYSLSSLSTPSTPSSVTSSPSASWRSRRKPNGQQRIIPSITMSEYVEGDKNGKTSTVVAHSQSLFVPMQFVEPLESSCDTVEGSSLELKVRVKGAEAVIWVKENKIIPNAPPDFQYFHEKSSDLYGLRISNVFVEDAGLYICEAYGAEGNEITCWCEVDVIEATRKDSDDNEEAISWEDSDASEEVKIEKPLVAPIIVTSVAEQDCESSPSFEKQPQLFKPHEPPLVKTVPVKRLVKKTSVSDEEVSVDERSAKLRNLLSRGSVDCDRLIHTNKHYPSKSSNESATFTATMKKSAKPPSEVTDTVHYGRDKCESTVVEERVTEFASENVVKETPEELDYLEKTIDDHQSLVAATPPVAIVIPKEKEQEDNNKEDYILNEDEAAVVTSQSRQRNDSDEGNGNKCILTRQLSSASDESIYLKEPRSGDEGALSSNEEASGGSSIPFLDGKNNNAVINDEEAIAEEGSSACSPFSEQNGRSSSVDSAIGFLGRPLFSDGKFPPRILVGPSNIIALYGEVVHLRVKVQNYGNPKTTVSWFKFINGTYKKIETSSASTAVSNSDLSAPGGNAYHVSVSKCGASLSTLTINQINYDDCGRYRVKVQNLLGMDSHDCLLTVEGPPEPPSTPPKVKYDEKSKTILIQWSSCPYDGGSKITGYYVEASIVQGSKTAINKEDQDNWQLLTPQSYSWLCYTLTEPKRGSVYRFRVFGENIYGKGKPTEPSLPLLVPVLMEGRRAGSSDALLWSLKSLNSEEASLRADSTRSTTVLECEREMAVMEESVSSHEEEEPVDYKNVTIKRDSLYNAYDKLDELGKGRFGVVFEVVDKISKKSYAGKFVKCIKAKDKDRVQLEVKIMNDLQYHPKLICLIDAFEMPREIIIITQRINGGELFERVVADDFCLTEGDCITFLRQICDAVGYIHTKSIMHLDLKPENILCTSKNSNSIKIIDFGLAQYHNPEEPIRVLFGTAEFVSPEIINYEPIAPSTDNWSIGVITYILLSGLSPFMGDNDNETFSNITIAEFDFDDEAFENISEDAKDFISNLIVKRPEDRMTAEECLTHRWLKRDGDDVKKRVIPTDKLKRFLVRRKWQKTGNAIRALGRITTLYSSRRSSSTSSTTPTGSLSMSVSTPPVQRSSPTSRSESLMTQDSQDYDNVFLSNQQQSPTKTLNKVNLTSNNNFNQSVNSSAKINSTTNANVTNANRSKYSDPCRSDSGVCDVGGSFSSSLNYD